MSEIVRLLSQVMEDVGAVKKGDRNEHQKFTFRGIDAVLNAVSPALRKHGVIVIPQTLDYQYETINVGNPPRPMGQVRVMVRYTFHAPDGSSIETVVPGESFDSGDKATAKAMSVAFRTCLIQALCLPTNETDPDAQTYERAAAKQNHPAGQTAPVRKPTAPVTDRQPGEAAPVVPIGGGKPASEKQVETIGKQARFLKFDDATLHTFVQATIGHDYGTLEELNISEASAVIQALNEAKQ